MHNSQLDTYTSTLAKKYKESANMDNFAHLIEALPPSIDTQPTPSRPRQQGALALLPTELLLMIMECPEIGRKELKSLALASSRLFGLVRPSFYRAEECHTFYKAVLAVDVATMTRCELFNAAPNSSQLGVFTGRCIPGVSRDFHRPIDILLETLELGEASLEACYECLKWLLDRNFSVTNDILDVFEVGAGGHGGPTMPWLLPNLLQREVSRERVEGICNMIHLMSQRGILTPAAPFDFVLPPSAPPPDHLPFDLDTYPFPIGDRHSDSMMQLAMRSHCPPSLLELVLGEYKARGIRLTQWHSECPPQLMSSFFFQPEPWHQHHPIGSLLESLHAELHPTPSGWAESYPGEVADVFEQKLKLLIEYRAVVKVEKQALGNILGALREITAVVQAEGGFGTQRHEKMSWEKLCLSVRMLARHGGMAESEDKRREPLQAGRHDRLHRFVITEGWNPWRSWYLRREAKELWAAWGLSPRRFHGQLNRDIHYHMEHLMPADRCPPWQDVGMDEWAEWKKKQTTRRPPQESWEPGMERTLVTPRLVVEDGARQGW
ncbi:hypothetical protein FZEAL_9503 [Fusarium zealandicum]|uniref:Uncharacterized protein n=1 Tax=Fusarium zealandicum TaxID=1053134 RepID=A0A8H4XG05_9HYPO|nr:hypothetical protein FZEAL_9503 [Fusarium zealandicum]